MSKKELIESIVAVTEPVYGAREARAIARLFAEHRNEATPTDLADLAASRPIQYVLGMADFYGLELAVGEGVLIPRPETEELVRWILDDIAAVDANTSATANTAVVIAPDTMPPAIKILDIGSGSGAIAIALAKNLPETRAHITAIDISLEALHYAHLNNERTAAKIGITCADALDPTFDPGLRDIIVSNPPYIPVAERAFMHDNVVKYEPGTALFVPDADSLVFYRAIARLARRRLTEKGRLYFEIHENASGDIRELLASEGFGEIVIKEDINSKPRMVRCNS